mmetsp:Transcript_83818/g.260642  ORF Transcript_83818/g.260642 Transcript_83818/m.260642 type:complete len:221 (+) Transcript_83818:96-758(+)
MFESSCGLKSPSCCKPFRASSEKSLSWRTPAVLKAQAALASSWQLAVCTMGSICAPTPRKSLASCCRAVAKAQAVITRHRKENFSAWPGMYSAAAWKKSEAHSQAATSTESSFAKAQRVAESSKGLKSATRPTESSATACSRGRSEYCTVAMAQVMLLRAWQCGEAPVHRARSRAARAAANRDASTGCSRSIACACGSLAVSLARRCRAVETFTRFISGT